MWLGSVNCSRLLTKAQSLVGMGKHEVKVKNTLPKEGLKGEIISNLFDLTTTVELSKINPQNSETMIIKTSDESMYIVFKLRKSLLSSTANLVNAKRNKEEYMDSHYIAVDTIYLLKPVENDKTKTEINYLLKWLDLLSLRYPKTDNFQGSTVASERHNGDVFKRLKGEIITALETHYPNLAQPMKETKYEPKQLRQQDSISGLNSIKDAARDLRFWAYGR